ncbi:hypothetical protein EDC01DRAFT_777927 [Geopyxis carbonaria]|nr:hypothetical protein EDC01DRAFT_777927 [Geopyxis carbonaria]
MRDEFQITCAAIRRDKKTIHTLKEVIDELMEEESLNKFRSTIYPTEKGAELLYTAKNDTSSKQPASTRAAPTPHTAATSGPSSSTVPPSGQTSGVYYVKGSGCDYHKSTTHTTAECWKLKRKRAEEELDQDADRECFHCHKIGHRQYNCPKKRAERRQEASQANAVFGQGNPPVFPQNPQGFQFIPMMMIPPGFDMQTYSNLLSAIFTTPMDLTPVVIEELPAEDSIVTVASNVMEDAFVKKTLTATCITDDDNDDGQLLATRVTRQKVAEGLAPPPPPLWNPVERIPEMLEQRVSTRRVLPAQLGTKKIHEYMPFYALDENSSSDTDHGGYSSDDNNNNT